MIRKEADRGRRPILFGANRLMIEEIRDSLSHVYQESKQQTDEPDGAVSDDFVALDAPHALTKTELSHSSPNLLDKLEKTVQERNGGGSTSSSISGVSSGGGGGPGSKMTRLGYNQKALAQIRNSLKPYKNCDLNCCKQPSCDIDAGQMLQELVNIGGDEVSIMMLINVLLPVFRDLKLGKPQIMTQQLH